MLLPNMVNYYALGTRGVAFVKLIANTFKDCLNKKGLTYEGYKCILIGYMEHSFN